MRLDSPTLFLSATAVIAFVGLSLILAARQTATRVTLLPWGTSILLGAAGVAVHGLGHHAPGNLTFQLANTLILAATGLAWSAARRFDGHATPRAATIGGAGAWLVAAQLPLPESADAALAAGLASLYLAAAGITVWRARLAEPLPSRGIAVLLLGLHAGVVAARLLAALLEAVPFAAALPLPGPEPWTVLLLLEAQLHAVGMALALLAMAKERAERQAGGALVAARDAALAANAAKSRFVAHLSHELRTPLGGVLGLAQSLTADPRLLDDQRLKAETLERAGRHLLAVAGDVLDLARAEAGKLDVVCRPVPLRDLLSDCEALTRAAAEEKGLALRVATAAGMPDGVLADPTRLRQVLLNLLSNAVKFTPEGGSVELRAAPAETQDGKQHGARLRIEVADTGPGIPADQRGRLFREFSQLGEAGAAAGAGLGLAICMALTEAMGGRIGQRPGAGGRGSIFWVELPASPGPAPAAGAIALRAPPLAPAPDPDLAPIPPLRLLVVDDIATNRMILRLLLEQDGHAVAEAASGHDAVQAVAEGGFDAVLMDAWMPDGDGLEATRRIRRLGGRAARVPIIGLTADARPARLQDCLAAGMDGCLAKPVQKAALLAALAEARAAAPEPSTLASA